MKKLILFLSGIFFLSLNTIAQTPDTLWTRCYGGSDDDAGRSIIQTNDGDFLILGKAKSIDGDVYMNHGKYDFWLLKITPLGDTLWTKTFGGTEDDFGISIQQTYDSGFILSGSSRSNDGDVTENNGSQDCWILKLNSSSEIIWTKTYGGSGDETITSIINTNDTSYLAVGYTTSSDKDVYGQHGGQDIWVIKINSSGDTIWTRTLGGSAQDVALSVVETFDGGFLIGGSTESNDGDVSGNHGDKDFWIIKLSMAGSVQWSKTYGGSSDERVQSLLQTSDSGFIISGYSWSFDGDVHGNHGNGKGDFWTLRIDKNGSIIWDKCYGGDLEEASRFISPSVSGGFIIGGFAKSDNGDLNINYGDKDLWVIKINDSGNISWKKSLGGSGWDEAWSIVETNDGYFVIGNSDSNNNFVHGNHGNSDFWVVKLTQDTKICPINIIWSKCYGGTANDEANSIQQTNDNGYIITGSSESNDGDVSGNHGGNDVWVIKINNEGDTIWTKTFGGSGNDIANAIYPTTDNGYIFAGYTSSYDGDITGNHGGVDVWIVKLDEEGDIIWSKCYGGSDFETANSIYQTDDEGYIFAGYTFSNDGDVQNFSGDEPDGWFVKIDDAGNIEWSGCIGINVPNLYSGEYINSIIQTQDGGYVFCGYQNSIYSNGNNHSNCAAFIKKLDNNGNIVWSSGESGSSVGDDSYSIKLNSIKQLANGDYVAVGHKEIIIPETWEYIGKQIWIISLDSAGNKKWSNYYGDYHTNYGYDIVQTNDGGFIVSSDVLAPPVIGYTSQMDLLILKLSECGDSLWSKQIGGNLNDYGRSILSTSNGHVIVAGYTESNNGYIAGNHGLYDFWVIKLDSSTFSPLTPATLPFVENWETSNGTLNTNDTIYKSNSFYWSAETNKPGKGRIRWGKNAYKKNSGKGALTLDHYSTSGDTAINYAILTINLANYQNTDIALAFSWSDHGDEENPNDKVWVRGSPADEWLEIYDLDPLDAPDNVYQEVQDLDIDSILGAAIPSQSVSASFQVRFGQEDNYFPPWDGISFDDIRITEANPCTLSPVTLPFLDDFEAWSGIRNTDTVYCYADHNWRFDTDHQGEGRARWGTKAYIKNSGYGALTLDHLPSSGDLATNFVILTLDMSNYTTSDLELAFAWSDHGDATHPNDKAWVRGSMEDDWMEIYDLDPSSAPDGIYQEIQGLDIDATLASASPPQTVSSTFQVRFGQEDQYGTPWDGISYDDIRVSLAFPCNLSAFTLPFTEDWESYKGIRHTDSTYCLSGYAWTFDTDHQGEGRARWGTYAAMDNSGTGALTMDHLPSSGDNATNASILTLNLSNYTSSGDLELSFSWADHNDEDNPGDKVCVRGSMEDEWVEIFDLDPEEAIDNVYQQVSGLDIDAVLSSVSPTQSVSSTFQIRFGQEDNYSTFWDGISYDDIVVYENVGKSSQVNVADINTDLNIYYSTGYIYLQSFGNAIFESKQIFVYDLYGRTVINQSVPPCSLYKIKVFPCSCYMVVKVLSQSQVKVKKVFVR